MRFVPKGNSTLAVALALVLFGGGITVGQTAEPAWSGELLTDLEGWAAAYNAQVEEVDFRGKSLIRGESVELHVRGEDGIEAVYSFRTDADTRIVDLQPGAGERTTLRLVTDRAVMDRIVADENPARALENALLSGRIGVKKVFHVLTLPIAVGPVEAVVGTVGLVAGAVAVAKVGLGGVSAKFIALIRKFQVLLVESTRRSGYWPGHWRWSEWT